MKLIKKISYLKRSEIIAISTGQEIILINPKSHHIEISLKMQEIKKTAYTNICRQFCENPEEQTGEDKFKLLKQLNLENILKDFQTFSLGNDLLCDEKYYKYSNTDWIFLLFEEELIDFDGDEITSLSFPFSLLLFKLLFLLYSDILEFVVWLSIEILL